MPCLHATAPVRSPVRRPGSRRSSRRRRLRVAEDGGGAVGRPAAHEGHGQLGPRGVGVEPGGQLGRPTAPRRRRRTRSGHRARCRPPPPDPRRPRSPRGPRTRWRRRRRPPRRRPRPPGHRGSTDPCETICWVTSRTSSAGRKIAVRSVPPPSTASSSPATAPDGSTSGLPRSSVVSGAAIAVPQNSGACPGSRASPGVEHGARRRDGPSGRHPWSGPPRTWPRPVSPSPGHPW